MNVLLPVSLLALLPAIASAAMHTINMTRSGNQITGTPAMVSVQAGDTIRIDLGTITDAQSTGWKFFLGPAEMNRAVSGGVVTYTEVVPNTGSPFAVAHTDEANQVVLANALQVTVGGGGGTTPPAPASAGADLVDNAFRPPYEQSHDVVNIYFDKAGFILNGDVPRDVDDNDAIRIYFFGLLAELRNLVVDIDGTFSSGDSFNVVGSGALGDVTKFKLQLQADGLDESIPQIYRVGTFGPYASPKITIKLSDQTGGTKKLLREYPVRINKTYLAAYRLLGIKSDIRYNDFVARSRAGATGNFISNVADEAGDTRYLVTFVPYGWQFWRKGNWRGRDIAKAPDPLERINPVLGVGLNGPRKEYLVGASVEVARGVDVVWGFHHVKVKTLTGGYKDGDAFTGETNAIPTREEGKSEHVWGVSIDLRVAVELLTSLFK
ncbi:MAG: hypothetical protein AABO58_23070 [Acidobacteriota bacterium]